MSTAVRSYRDLRVWQEAMDLMVEAYAVAMRFPRDELYGLTSQVRRAAVSVVANVAEGHGRDHLGDYLYHLSVAKGSLTELETELLAAQRLGYIRDGDLTMAMQKADGVSRMLSGLSAALAKRRRNGARRTTNRAPTSWSR